MTPASHFNDRQTHRRVIIVGVLFCAAFVAISFALRPQPDGPRVVHADRLVKTAGGPPRAH